MEKLQFDFDRYPYITPLLPGLGGVIRHQRRDFQVYEVPAYSPSGEGEHLYLLIEKEGLTTREVFLFLRDRMAISEKDIGAAGLKDKHALTRQWFSIPRKYQDRVETLENLAGLRLIESGAHTNKLRVGHLKGNRFRILIRQPEPGSEGAEGLGSRGAEERRREVSFSPAPLHRTTTPLGRYRTPAQPLAETIFRALQEIGVPNYYGPQRFGLKGLNPVRGYELVKAGKSRGNPRTPASRAGYAGNLWLNRFLIGSLQSLLFNDWLALRIEQGIFNQVIGGDVAKKHDTGGEFVVEDVSLENPRALRFEISAMGALHGKKYREAQGEARTLEDQILSSYDLTRQDFAARRGDRRMIRFPLEEWSVEAVPEGIWVSFFLPKGAYATSILREMMKKNPEQGELEQDENQERED